MIHFSAILAIVCGTLLGIGEIIRNWGDWQWWPFWAVDYMAAALLIFGGQRALKRGTVRWLTGAWGFTTGMAYMSFFSHQQFAKTGIGETTGPLPEGVLTTIIGIGTVIAFIGFFTALAGKRQSRA